MKKIIGVFGSVAYSSMYGTPTKKQLSQNVTDINSLHKIQRNDLCPCNSKLKYKKCCGKNA
jgi:uncharacterized protein YecA (UPF0149 family)